MLNLEKLEKKLDNALTNETNESLTNWLQKKRELSFLQSLGKGALEKLSGLSTNNELET